MAYQFASVRRVATSEVAEIQPADPFLSRLLSIGTLTPEQARAVTLMQAPPRNVPSRTQLGRPGEPAKYVIRDGWAFVYTLLANGERQVINFLLPGDLVRTGCDADGSAELSVETITNAVISEISSDSVRDATRQWPELLKFFFRLQGQAVLALVDQVVDLGRRDSRARLAQLLLKLERRLLAVGHAGPDGYHFPASQYLIADSLGLTAIHVNRVLRGLREEGVATLRNERVTIHDRARLMQIAGEDVDDVAPTAMVGPPARAGRRADGAWR